MTTQSPESPESPEPQKAQETHCGFVGLIGRPNVGKSTLMNTLIGQKVSITASKPQTTRNRILGILTAESHQFIFMDTPGIHQPSRLLNERIVEYALQTLAESDINLFIVEPVPAHKKGLHPQDAFILENLQKQKKAPILVINKMDTVPDAELLRSIDLLKNFADFAEIIPISALKRRNTERLLQVLKPYMPPAPFYFEEGQITDSSERFLVGEFMREALFRILKEELPYSIAVRVDDFIEEPNCIRLHCTIFVERESQKGIIIGKGGSNLKKAGSQARVKMEYLLGNKVFLSTQVNVLKKWSRNPTYLDGLGLH